MSADLPLEYISVEPDVQHDGQAPAIILLHGRGATEEDLLPLAQQMPGDMHILSFRGPISLGPGYTWYELDLSGGGLHASQPDMADFNESLTILGQSIDQAVDVHNLDPERIGLLGFSQGAILSMSAMVERPTTYAWVVALHGYLPETYDTGDISPASDTPVFIGAGEGDQIIPVTRAEQAATRLTDAGLDVTFRSYNIGHGTSPAEVTDVREWLLAHADIT